MSLKLVPKSRNMALCVSLSCLLSLLQSGSGQAGSKSKSATQRVDSVASSTLTNFQKLACAVVRIQSDHHEGTGFFIDADGHVVTAGHVVLSKRVIDISSPDHKYTMSATPRLPLKIFKSDGTSINGDIRVVGGTMKAWYADLAVLTTGEHPSCWLPFAKEFAPIGEHVRVIGFPAFSFGSPALLEGVVSSIFQSRLAGIEDQSGAWLVTNNDSYAIQMPTAHGTSGSPVINGAGEVIAIMDANGEWNKKLDNLLVYPELPQGKSPSIMDYLAALAKMQNANIPGIGEAVPISYLDFPLGARGAMRPR